MKTSAQWAPVLALAFALGAPAAAQRSGAPAKTNDVPKSVTLPAGALRSGGSTRVGDVPKIAITQFTLPNGLRVVLHEDHSSPVISMQVWYHVGSKHDIPGKTGLAHMFEHMLDEGTLNMPPGEFRRTIQGAGGTYNAGTSTDWTFYWATLPSNHLETLLWLEAERMANLSPALDSTRFRLEREAVYNEYRQVIQGVALRSGAEAMFEALFGEGTYRFSPIGNPADLARATVEDLRAFYEKYYVPNNAVLVIAGDLNVAEARRLVTKHFAPIPRGKPIVQPKAIGELKGEKRVVVEHPEGQRQLWVVWRGARSSAPDRPAALALSSILAERMRRLLVTERKLVSVIPADWNTNIDLEESGLLHTNYLVTGSATEVERLVDSVTADIRANGVTAAEVRRWIANYRIQTLLDMQGVYRKAELLGDAAVVQGNPLGTFNLMERALTMTPQQVQAAARKYMTADRVVLNIIPTGKLDLISRPDLPYVNLTRKP